MKSNKSFDLTNILVYLVIILLLCLIALPPIFRKVFKEEEKTNIEMPSAVASALICNKEVTTTNINYQIRITTNYTGATLNKITLLYKRIGNVAMIDPTQPVEIEIQTLQGNSAFTAEAQTDGIKFISTGANLTADPTNALAKAYYNDITTQTNLLSQNGYTCQVITS